MIWGLIIGFIIGIGAGYFLGRNNSGSTTQDKDQFFVNNAEKIKSENMIKLKDYLAKETDGEINNEDVRTLLNVSDTTACRYLDNLEKEGLIKQVGTDGPKVYYKKARV